MTLGKNKRNVSFEIRFGDVIEKLPIIMKLIVSYSVAGGDMFAGGFPSAKFALQVLCELSMLFQDCHVVVVELLQLPVREVLNELCRLRWRGELGQSHSGLPRYCSGLTGY